MLRKREPGSTEEESDVPRTDPGFGPIEIPPFTVDLQNQELLREGAAIPLRPRTFGVLAYLVRHPERLISKRELIDEIWGDVVVTDHLVAVCVSELRKALGDTARDSRFIRTVHRRGYRFVAPVISPGRITPQRNHAEPGIIARNQCADLLELAEKAWQRGAFREARDAARRAASIARQVPLPNELARAALALGGPSPRPSGFNELGAALDEALRWLPSGDSALKARVLAQLAVASYLAEPRQTREQLCHRAVAMARRVGESGTLQRTLESSHRALWEPHHLAWRFDVANELVETGSANDDYQQELSGLSLRAIDRFECADLEEMEADLARYHALAESKNELVHVTASRWFQALGAAAEALLRGRLSEVQHLAERALALGERLQPDVARQNIGIQLFFLHREQGDLQTLLAGVTAAAPDDPRGPGWRTGLAAICCPDFRQRYAEFWNDPGWHVGAALVHADLGQLDRAGEHLATLARDGFADLLRNPSWMAASALLAEVCVALNDRESAKILRDALAPWSERHVIVGPASCIWGSVSRPLALLSCVLESWDDAEKHFSAATAAHARLDAQPLLARTRYEHARMLLARGRPHERERCLELVEESARAAERMGMSGLAAATERLRSTCSE